MGVSTSIEVTHKCVDGLHIFQCDAMPGFYVANRDPRRAYEAVCPGIELLIKLDTNIECRAVPDVSFAEFISNVRSQLTACVQRQRFTLYKEAA